jgi:hypothetical protein
LYEIPHFFYDVVANRTRIDEDDYLRTSLLYEHLNLAKNEILRMLVCYLWSGREGYVQPSAGNLGKDYISREFEVHRPGLHIMVS